MEVRGVPFTFRFPFFPAFTASDLAFRRPPLPSAAFRLPPPPYLSYTSFPQRRGNRRLAVSCASRLDPPAPDKDEARAILRNFLTDHGMRSDLAEWRAASWDAIAELLSSKLRSLHESEQQLGVQLAEHQLVDVLTPYLRLVLKDYDDIPIVGEDGKLPSTAPGGERTVVGTESRCYRRKREAIARLEKLLSVGCPHPNILHLMNLGLNLHQIRSMVRVYPSVAVMAIKQKLDRLVEFLVSLGMPESDVPQVLYRCPSLIGFNIEENIVPSMALLESKGVDKAQWPKIIYCCPEVFNSSKSKVEAVVEYFAEMGLSAAAIGRQLTQCPYILQCSLEAKIKPTDRFLLDSGFTMDEVHDLVFTWNIYGLSLERNLKPKWEFFLTTGYTRLDLLKYPSYFSHSLEKRIKPRYQLAAKHGIRWSLGHLLAPSNAKFAIYMESAQKRHESTLLLKGRLKHLGVYTHSFETTFLVEARNMDYFRMILQLPYNLFEKEVFLFRKIQFHLVYCDTYF